MSDAYSDLGGGAAQPPPAPPVRRDRHGMIDKAAPDDEEYPREWTPEQRVKASWAKIQARRDQQEYEQATNFPNTLLKEPPAGEATRASALQDFASSQMNFDDLDEDDPDEAVLYMNPLLVRCPFCHSTAGEPCTKPGMAGHEREKLTDIAAHPSRIEAAAKAKGMSDELAQALATTATKRQARKARASWPASMLSKPLPAEAPKVTSGGQPQRDTSPERGREVAESGVHAPPAGKSPAQPPSEMGWRDEKGRLHFPDSEVLDRDFAKRYEKLFGTP